MNDRRFLCLIITAALVYAITPYIAGMLASGPDVFTGIHAVAPGDINVYYAMINQAEHHALAFRNVFSTESVAPDFVNPFWLVVGLFGGLFRFSPEWAFHLARLVSGVFLIVLLARFVREFFQKRMERRIALITTICASGIGVLALLAAPGAFADPYQRPMDLWVSESSVLLSILHSAHFVVGTLLMVLGFWMAMKAYDARDLRPAVFSGLSFLALFSFHPFHVPTVLFVFFITAYGERMLHRLDVRRFFILTVPVIISLPAAVYHSFLTFTDPMAAARASQNVNLIPNIPSTLASYGFLLPLAAIGSFLWLQRSARHRFIVWWALAHFSIIFAPLFFNRRLTQGLGIPLAILAVAGARTMLSWWRARKPKREPLRFGMLSGALVLFFFALSPLFVLARDISLIAGRQEYEQIFYRPSSEQEAYRAFRTMSKPTDRFFSGAVTGNTFAAQTLRHAYLGHSVETIHFEEKKEAYRDFFADWDSTERAAFLVENQLSWIILRVEEFSHADTVTETPGVREVFANDAVLIYSFSPPEL